MSERVDWPVHITDEGDPALPAVVFLHAFPYHRAMWEGQRAALSGRARFVSFDARGVGRGAPAAAPYMLEHMVDDLFALLDRLQIRQAVLCGLSMGGYVALRAVEREPSRISGLLLSDTQASADSEDAKLARAAGLRGLASDGVARFAEQQLKRQLSPHTLSQRPDVLTHLTSLIVESTPEGIAGNLVALATRTDVRTTLADIRVPTSIVVGADDTITPPAVARSLSEAITGAELHVLAHAGHLANVEAEDAFNEQLLALLARVTR